MPVVRANGLRIAYDSFGNPNHEPMILVMGLGCQMIGWRDGICRRLAQRGFYIIRFDNRDIGLSERVRGAPPNLKIAFLKRSLRLPLRPSYTISDMAKDVLGLMNALEIPSGHLVGASMGGMIAQRVAIDAPERVRSLGLLMSTTSDPRLPWPRRDVRQAMLTPAPKSRQAFIEHQVGILRLTGSPRFFDAEEAAQYFGAVFDRCRDRSGVSRHLHAVLAARARVAELSGLRVPTVVIHGAVDPLLPPAHGRALARCIPGAEFRLMEGMGHDLPRALWGELVDAIHENARYDSAIDTRMAC